MPKITNQEYDQIINKRAGTWVNTLTGKYAHDNELHKTIYNNTSDGISNYKSEIGYDDMQKPYGEIGTDDGDTSIGDTSIMDILHPNTIPGIISVGQHQFRAVPDGRGGFTFKEIHNNPEDGLQDEPTPHTDDDEVNGLS